METLVGVRIQETEEYFLNALLDIMMARKPGVSVDDCLDEIFRRGTAATARLYEGERND